MSFTGLPDTESTKTGQDPSESRTDGLEGWLMLGSRTRSDLPFLSEGSYETLFLSERSDMKRRPFAGASL